MCILNWFSSKHWSAVFCLGLQSGGYVLVESTESSKEVQ